MNSLSMRITSSVRICKSLARGFGSAAEIPVVAGSKKSGEFSRPDTWCQYYDRPTQEPIESTSILLFPGQGAHFVGMAKNLIGVPGVKDMFDTVSSILRTDLLKTCLEGPVEKLTKTIHCQPAVYVTGLASLKKLQNESPEVIEKCVAAAGYSVGEITALAFAGAFTFEEGLHIIRVRAESMQRVSDLISSGMCSVVLRHDSQLRTALAAAISHCKDDLKLETPVVCQVAAFLAPDCKVIAGNTEALEFIKAHAEQFQLGAVKDIPVESAFHTPLMQPAVEPVKNALIKVGIPHTTAIPVVCNVTGEPYTQGSNIPRMLVKQLTRPLCWEQSMHALFARPPGAPFPRIIEVGPGRQLGSILRRVNKKAFERYEAVEV